MKNYELACIFRPDVEVAAVKAKVDEWIAGMSATVLSSEEWGVRRLAYPVQKSAEGYYVFTKFSAEPAAILPVKKLLQLDGSLLRFLFLLDEPVRPPKKKKQRSAPAGGGYRPPRRPRFEAGEDR